MSESSVINSLNWVQETAGFLQRSDLPGDLPDELPREVQQGDQTPASVLIPLFRNDSEWHVMFIRRVASERDRHSGQVAFPGGRQDLDDADPVAAALREAHEEIGLDSARVKVIRVLPKYLTSSSYVVTPVIGIVPWPYDYQAQPTEVDRIFSIPLRWLADQSNVELRDKQVSRGQQSATLKVVYYNTYDSEVLWGASARMMISLLKSLHLGEIKLDGT